jgi:hypothetical protein
MLHVQVYGEATIAGDYAVETDGKIDLPLIAASMPQARPPEKSHRMRLPCAVPDT